MVIFKIVQCHPGLTCSNKANKLHLNIDKTCYYVFSPNKIPVPTVTIKINDAKIKCVKECK